MIRNAIQFAAVMLTVMLPMASAQNPSVGSIEGIVVASGSSTPVPRATVTLTKGRGNVATLTTARDGRFSVSNLSPGEYRIVAASDGFVSNSRGAPLSIVSGSKTEITVSIVPDGAISGRVVDWEGIPVVGIQVQALAFTQDARGRRILSVVRSSQTNDLGEYRIYWIPPGQYFVNAETLASDVNAIEHTFRIAGLNFEQRRTTGAPGQLVPTYFPSAVDASGARRIDLRAGETYGGADIQLIEMRKKGISGTMPASGGSTRVQLTPRNPASGIKDVTVSADRTGAFRFVNVVPGSYFLTAQAADSDGQMFGRVMIDVGNDDVENLTVSLTAGFDLRVRLTIEGRSRRPGDPQPVINLRPEIPDTPFPTVERNGNDEFTMHRVMLGDYSVRVLSLNTLPSPIDSSSGGGLYLKSAQYGGADVLTTGLHVEGPPSGVLDIVMADGAGTLTGTILDDQRQPASVVTVVLIPELQLRGRNDLYKTATTDLAGKFEISGIAPGQYKVFSWEAAKQGEWQYPEFLDLYEDRGQSIRIDGNRRDPITVTLIPSIN